MNTLNRQRVRQAYNLCALMPMLLMANFSLAENTYGKQALLSVEPNRCIALHRGQTCYQNLRFSWQTFGEAEYCLFQSALDTPLLCWTGDAKTLFEYEFKSSENQDFYLRQKGSNENIHSVSVTVSWVYKSKKATSRNWRMF